MKLLPIALLPFAAFAACSGSELVGIHVTLAADGSGTVTTRSLQRSTAAGPAESRIRGAEWRIRAAVVSSQGAFARITDLAFGDGEIRFLASNDDLPRLRVILRRGPDLSWVPTLTPDAKTRQTLATVHDPTGRTREIGDTIRIEIDLPDTVVASGVQPTVRGVEAAHDRKRAYLSLPVDELLQRGDDLVWDISWK